MSQTPETKWYMTNRMLKNRTVTVKGAKEHVNAYGQSIQESPEESISFNLGLLEVTNDELGKRLEKHKFFGHPNPHFGFRKLSAEEVSFLNNKLIARGITRNNWHARLTKFREVMGDGDTA